MEGQYAERRSPSFAPDQPDVIPPCPTLAFIDRALGELRPSFADDPNARQLEQSARELTRQYWSELVWVTGTVPAAAFLRVCDELERERQEAARPTPTRTIGSAA